jgi:NAD+ synthetase
MIGRVTSRRTVDEIRDDLRAARAFDADEVLGAKVGRINRWFANEQLDAAVIGVSGGIDSAVALGLLHRARHVPGSPLRDVVGVSVPIGGKGATGQDRADARARMVAESFGTELWSCPLDPTHRDLLEIIERASGRQFDCWAAGQMLSVERTPVLYGAAALLQSAGLRSVVVGTTNRDEGAYLGFFGKASDGMVDAQILSDLHKSEVVALAHLLGVPSDVIDSAPSGDVWDGRTDVQMIGATYEEVEVILRLREIERQPCAVADLVEDGRRLRDADVTVERLHVANRHKYRVGGAAVHLDVMPRAIPGGWDDGTSARRSETAPADLPGAWGPRPIDLDEPGLPRRRSLASVIVADDVLTAGDCGRLIAALDGAPGQQVGVTGVVGAHGIGSVRSTAFSEELASKLWRRVRAVAPSVRFLGPHDASEGHRGPTRDGHRSWRIVGLSPLLRFMRYENGGRHLCHYDAAYAYPDGRRTLMSVVFFLTGDGSSERGGALRFVDDGQGRLPVWERDHSDWTVETNPAQVVAEVFPRAGAVVLFDHRRCHDVARWIDPAPRIVIRGDLVYEPIHDGRGLG